MKKVSRAWYSAKQRASAEERAYTQRDPLSGLHYVVTDATCVYRRLRGGLVVVTEVGPVKRKSGWDDAVDLGLVTTCVRTIRTEYVRETKEVVW